MGRVRKGLDPTNSTKKPKANKLARSKKRTKKLGPALATDVNSMRRLNSSLVGLRALSFRNPTQNNNPYFYQFYIPIAEDLQKINVSGAYPNPQTFAPLNHLSYEEQAKYVRDYAKLVDSLGDYQTMHNRPFRVKKLKRSNKTESFEGQLKTFGQKVQDLKMAAYKTPEQRSFMTIGRGVRESNFVRSKQQHS